MALVFLHERISLIRWMGIALIVLGIYFVSKGKQRTPEGTPHHV
jgi:drug/metabolite transporter (DMT)-like permease